MTAGNGTAPHDVDPRFARSVARWLRAYPRRWRAARTAEVTDLLADLAPPAATRLDVRSGLGLVRAGWATRWREHPPLVPWLLYVGVERRLDARYRDWVRDDIEGPLFPLRRAVAVGWVVVAVSVVQGRGDDTAATPWLGLWLSVFVAFSMLWARFQRDRATEKHLTIRPGDVVTPAGRIHALVARTRLDARTWTTAAAAWVATTVAVCATILLTSDRVLVATGCGRACRTVDSVAVTDTYLLTAGGVAGAALLVGGALSLPARRRLRRWVPVAQHARWVTPLRASGVVRLVAGGLGLAGLAVAVPDLATAVAGVLLVAAALALPVLLTARRVVAAGGTRATAGIEVLRAVLGRRDTADRAVPGFLPATTWLPAGQIAPPPATEPYPAVPRDI